MASIRQLKSGSWNVQIRTAGLTLSKTFSTKVEAEVFAREKQEKASLNFHDVCDLYVRLMGKNVKHRVNSLKRGFDEAPTIASVENYKRNRLKKVKSSTVRLDLQMLSRIVKFGIEHHGLSWSNPFNGFRYPSACQPRDRVVTPKELAALCQDLPELVASATELSFETAMRRGEIVNIRRADIEFHNRRLYVPIAKNGHPRFVPLNSRAIEILKERIDTIPSNWQRLYPVNAESLSKAFRRACKRLAIEGLSFHSMRHSAITKYAKRGLSLAQLKVVSGHRSTEMLERYTHLKVDDVLSLID